MDTTYAGIDYGLGRSNIDPATGIRFGVIAQYSLCPEAFDECWMQGRDLTYEAAVADFKTRLAQCENGSELRSLVRKHCGHRVFQGDLDGITVGDVEAIWAEVEDHFNDSYAMGDCGERDWLYEQNGYKLTNCLSTDVMVLASPYFTYARFCSPCVPGACNLDSPLDPPNNQWESNKCYCLGHDWFDAGKAPYPVYRVDTGELVEPDASL